MTDYSKMSDFEINCEIARLMGYTEKGFIHDLHSGVWNPCNNPADAWPIIIENHIAVVPYKYTLPQAWPTSFGLVSKFTTEDRNPLRAAMITFLKMQESQNAKVPSERDS